jgi:hypothetical protein
VFPGEDALAAQSASSQEVEVQAAAFLARAASVLGWVALAVALLLAALAAVVYMKARSSQRVVRVLEQAERQIRAGDPWAAAVLLAYRRLSDYVATLGFDELPGETPRAFVDALRARVPVPDDAAVALVVLFERARYLGGSMEASDARWARTTLHAIIRSIQDAIKAHSTQGPARREVST